MTDVNAIEDFETGVGAGEYEAPSDFRRPCESGEHTFIRICDDEEKDFNYGSFEYNGAKAIWVNAQAQVAGGSQDGMFAKAGMNTLVSQYAPRSTADDFIRACGSAERPTTGKGYITTIAKLFGPFKARVDWEWGVKVGEDYVTFLKGQKNPKVPKKFRREYPDVVVTVIRDNHNHANHVQRNPFDTEAEVGAKAVITQYVVKTAAAATVTAQPALAGMPEAGG